MATTLVLVSATVDSISTSLKLGGELITVMQEFGKVVATAVAATQKVHEEIHNEEIKRIYQVKTAQHDLLMVTEKAFEFLDYVDDVVCFCTGKAMTVAMEDFAFLSTFSTLEGYGECQ